MMNQYGLHERLMVNYIKEQAIEHGFVEYKDFCNYKQGDKIFYVFRDKLIILMKLGLDFKGANMIVSHLDSPRLDVIVGNPLVEKEDGVFLKTIPFGGIIQQSWLDRPLALVGRVEDKDGNVIDINTKEEYNFVISSLLPHLDGRKEMKELKYEKLLVRIGNKKENVLKVLQEKYNLADNFLEFADLSFVPSDAVREVGFDRELLTGYGHDDKCCAYAELQAFFEAELKDMSQVAIFASYEETGSRQSTGCQSDVIEDFFVDVMQSVRTAKAFMRNSFMISADVCAGYEHQYAGHFEDAAKAVVGKGTAVVPYLGRKSGNDSSFEIRKFIKDLLVKNEIDYSIETTKVSEGGGGTVSSFFAVKGCEIIDVGIPVLAMHSPQEMISKHDLYETYRIYKAFYESR
jgi:aspartyl aminopeptidase